MKKNGRWTTIKRNAIILFVLGLLFFHFYAPRFITEIKNPLIEKLKGASSDTPPITFENDTLPGRYINFKSFDNTELSCYLTYTIKDTTKGTVILLHGIRSSKECFIKLASKLASWGYNSVALDSRAHGQSEGTHCTFGVKEKKDISALVTVLTDELNTHGKTNKNIGIWGQSLGGAIALQALGSDNRLCFGIIESTFSDFKTITHDYFNFHLGLKLRPVINYLIHRAGVIADFDPEKARPLIYCHNIHQPILLVHGNADKRINIKYARANFAKTSSTRKDFIEIENANHLNIWKIGGSKYFKTVFEFMENNSLNMQDDNLINN